MMNWRSDPNVGLKDLVDQRCSASAGGRKGRTGFYGAHKLLETDLREG